MNVINTWNDDSDDLPFDGDPRFISIKQISFINGDIVESFNNVSIVDLHESNVRRIKV